jgi:hypothetical protein
LLLNTLVLQSDLFMVFSDIKKVKQTNQDMMCVSPSTEKKTLYNLRKNNLWRILLISKRKETEDSTAPSFSNGSNLKEACGHA